MTSPMYSRLDDPEILRVLFHPRPDLAGPPPAGVEEVAIPVAPDVALRCRFHPAAAAEAPVILFFHGNGEIASDYDDVGPLYNEHGIGFLVATYRGYGGSDGAPSVATMMSDCHAVYDHVRQMLAETGRTGPLLAMGRSLGSAPAIELAASHADGIKGLIVESGFALTMPLLHTLGIDFGGMGLTEANGFGNIKKIAGITMPTLILHAQYDQLIPTTNAELLQVQSPAHHKEFQVVPNADHNTIMEAAGPRYYTVIRRFIDKIMKIRPRRYTRPR